MTITEFARMGGKARAKKLGKRGCKESARLAAQVRWARVKLEKEQAKLNQSLGAAEEGR